jgi:hypothetical protein
LVECRTGLQGFSEINLAMVAKRDNDARTKQRGDRAREYTDGFLTLVRCSEREVVAAWKRQQQQRCTAASCVDRQRREQNREQAASTSSADDDVRLDGAGFSLTGKSAADREHRWGFRWRARLRRRLAAQRDRSSAAAAAAAMIVRA